MALLNISQEKKDPSPWSLRYTQRCMTKMDQKNSKIVMFYTSPLNSEFVEIKVPQQISNLALDSMTLVEPYYIFGLGVDHQGRDSF
mmetsp:Transcript_12060/g.10661  ORF Transcript_12060/g.10661 Transcript_12060/m.10661 type:complete len:86 (-) Transcript_12060:593-850(-)